jgi:hypothetical protein
LTGKFLNWKNRLNLNNNPYAEPGQEVAEKLLEDNDFTLPWIEKGQRIERELTVARKALKRTWDWTLIARERGEEHTFIKTEWATAQRKFREKVEEINKIIRDYNLEIPNIHFERMIINIERDIERVKKGE